MTERFDTVESSYETHVVDIDHTSFVTGVQAPHFLLAIDDRVDHTTSDTGAHSPGTTVEAQSSGVRLRRACLQSEDRVENCNETHVVNIWDAEGDRLPPELYKAAVEGDVGQLRQFVQSSDLLGQSLRLLLQRKSTGGNTLLHIAATSSSDLRRQLQYREFAEVCLQNGLSLMARNKLWETPLHCAAKAGNSDMITLFYNHQRGIPQENGQTPQETLMKARNTHGETALHEAVRFGHKNAVETLILNEGSLMRTVDHLGVSPLYLATMANNLDIVQIFTKVPFELSYSAGPRGQTALHAAALESTEITKELILEWDKSPNKPLATKADDTKSTPLHYAASVGKLDTVMLLLNHGAKRAAYMEDRDGLFPIHVAAKCGRASVIKVLVEKFPDSDELLDGDGRNFLHIAIINMNGHIISHIPHNDTLLRMLNARDKEGNTPLHLAAEKGTYLAVRSLISMEMVYSSILNRDGLTPVDLAIKEVDRGFGYTLNTKVNVLRCLLWTGALPSSHRFDHFDDDLKLPKGDTEKEIQKIESGTRSMVIISVLVATVTFAACFTMPGGYIADDHVKSGTPILSRKYAFKAFIVADLLAFGSSMFATHWLLYAGFMNVEFKIRMRYLVLSIVMANIACKATVIALALAVYAMLYQVNLPIGILVCLLTFGLLPFNDLDYWRVVSLAAPIVKRLGWKGLYKFYLRPETMRRTERVSGVERMFAGFVCGRVFLDIILYGIIFLGALI